MNLVEDFDVYRTSYATGPVYTLDAFSDRAGSPGVGEDAVIVEAPSASNGYDMPLLSVETTIRQAARGRGQVICVCCCNEHVIVATSRGFLLHYHWDEYSNERVTEVEVSKVADARIQGLFVDPTGHHALITLRTAAGMETHYAHRRWLKSKPLAKLKGVAITAVGWCHPACLDDEGERAGSIMQSNSQAGSEYALTDACSGPILVGTDAGVIMEVVVEERQKKEHTPKTLLAFKGGRTSPICAIYQEDTSARVVPGPGQHGSQLSLTSARAAAPPRGPHRVVVVATSCQLYLFEGGASLEALFARYAAAPALLGPALEAVAPSPHSQLQLYCPPDSLLGTPARFAWLVGNVVYHGELVLDPLVAAEPAGDRFAAAAAAAAGGDDLALPHARASDGGTEVAAPQSGGSGTVAAQRAAPLPQHEAYLRNISSLPLVGSTGQAADEPRSLVMTEYHFLVLAADRLQAINRVSGRVVQEIAMKSPLTRNVSGENTHEIVGLLRDELGGKLFMYSDESLLEVSIQYEARDMWQVYLELQDWDQALRLCSSPAQRDEVHRARASTALASGDHNTAAVHFAKIQGGRPAFEEVALQLVGTGSPEALQLFLSTRLASLSRSDRAQATMLAAWLTELYLDQINKALLEASGQATERYRRCEEQLRMLLQEQVEVLDVSTTLTLLATYGRLDDLLHYAAARGDNEAVLEYLMQRQGGAARALAVLRKPSVGQELVYKFAPALVAAATEEAIDFFITAQPPPDPRRLLPALLRFGEPHATPAQRRAVLRYVEFSIDMLGSTDSAVHNLAVALLAMDEGEHALISYLQRARSALGKPYFDTKYALRMATERKKPRACIKLLCELGIFEDAVQLALLHDLELAKAVASQPDESEEALKRKLWLAVARHVVQAQPTVDAADQAASIKQAVEFLREAGGLLKIEDILPFFPDFVTIDNFKDAICDSLEHYNRQIEDLKREMAEATDIAEAVRRDLKVLSTRTATVSLSQPCARCERHLSDVPPPCGLPSGGVLPPFFLFPTGLAYHSVCCAAELVELVTPQRRAKVVGLTARLARVRAGHTVVPPAAPNGHEEPLRAVQAAFVEEVASEDPRNGEVTIRLVDMPFINDKADKDELLSWKF